MLGAKPKIPAPRTAKLPQSRGLEKVKLGWGVGPNKNAITMPQELTIRVVLNGWVIQAGCQTVVFNDKAAFLTEFSKWLEDPQGTEKRYTEKMQERGLYPPTPQAVNADRIDPPATAAVGALVGQAMQERAVQERRRG